MIAKEPSLCNHFPAFSLIVSRKGFSPHIPPPDFLFIFIPPNHPTPDIHKMKEPWVFGRDFGVLIVWGIVIFCNFVGW